MFGKRGNGEEKDGTQPSAEGPQELSDWVKWRLPPQPKHGAPAGPGRADIGAAVSQVFDRKLDIIKEAIDEIEDGLKRRGKLNESFEGQIDREMEEVQDLLGGLPYPWSEGFQPKVEFLRVSLHKSLLTRRKDKRAEQLSHWDDLVTLLGKKRKFLMDYQDLLAARESLGSDHA